MGAPRTEIHFVDARAADIALATDLYELTMAASYLDLDIDGIATFSLFVRELPENRSFLVAAGLEEACRRLDELSFDQPAVDYVASTAQVRVDMLDAIARTRFEGEVWAVREGRAIFPGEPLLEVQARIVEAQIAEPAVLNAIHFPTSVASKAARCVAAARGRPLVDFGLRRTPGIEASVVAARACYLAGFEATSNVLAGRRLGVPIAGTVAHSFIELFPSELEAFRAFAGTFHRPVTLLVDTYDTMNGVAHAIRVAKEVESSDHRVEAIRLDSGDLLALGNRARHALDEAGLKDVKIVASGGLDEYEIERLTRAGAPIDAYGVGTRVGTAADAPVLDMAYKLVEYDGRPCLKLSTAKQTLVGPKQVWRRRDPGGRIIEDLIATRDEPSPGDAWEPLLEPVMRAGRPLPAPPLAELRRLHLEEMASLPPELLALRPQSRYPIELSPALIDRQTRAVDAARAREGLT